MILESLGNKKEALQVIETTCKQSAAIMAYRKSKLFEELELFEVS